MSKNKIGRNTHCPCGSGIKYKYCCLDEEAALMRKMNAFSEDYSMISKQARIKQCIHPNKNECSGNIIKAHAIQNNRVLSKLAVNGMVQTMDGVSNLIFQDAQCKGRKIATTFTGFCANHDKTLFQDIEDSEFETKPKQIFLFTYRTLAWHYHKKLEQIKKTELTKKMAYKHNLPGIENTNNYFNRLLDIEKMGARENEMKLEKFNQCLLNEEYGAVNSCIWEIPYEIQFAVSTMLEIEHDISGKQMNDLKSIKPLKSCYLNIFPAREKSYCIWSWLAEDDIYECFTQQFINLSIENRTNYLNNDLPRWTDALVFSPRIWGEWGEGIQQALISHANFDILYRQMEDEEQKHAYEYMDTPWDFFIQ